MDEREGWEIGNIYEMERDNDRMREALQDALTWLDCSQSITVLRRIIMRGLDLE